MNSEENELIEKELAILRRAILALAGSSLAVKGIYERLGEKTDSDCTWNFRLFCSGVRSDLGKTPFLFDKLFKVLNKVEKQLKNDEKEKQW